MKLNKTTPVPNILFDEILCNLNKSELKLLLFIIRQTNGWINTKTKQRRTRARITHFQIKKQTRISKSVLSTTIQALIDKKLIIVSDYNYELLPKAHQRKGKTYLFYSHHLSQLQKSDCTIPKNRTTPVLKLGHNKRNKIDKEKRKLNTNSFQGKISECIKARRTKLSMGY